MPQEQQNGKNKNPKGANKEVGALSLVSPGSLWVKLRGGTEFK